MGERRRVARAILLAACVGSIGCGAAAPATTTPDGSSGAPADGGVVAVPLFTDGARLVARWYSFPGTPALFAGIYDRQAQTGCAFGRAADGQVRCLPESLKPPAAPPERWAPGTEQAGDDPTTRVRSHWVTSEDGGRFPNRLTGELYDAKAARACAPVPRTASQPSETRCLPNTVWATGRDFADAACSEPLAFKLLETDMPAMVVLPDGALHEVGALFNGQLYSNLGPGGCGPALPSVPFLVRVGAPLPADAVPLVDVVPRGTGRLALRLLESEGVPLAPVRFSDGYGPYSNARAPYLDGTLGLDCQPVWTADGEYRCLPGDADYTTELYLVDFADPACTQLVINSDKRTAVIMAPRDASGRWPALAVRRLDEKSTTTAYHVIGGKCSEYPKGAGRRVLESVPLSTYARLDASPAP